MRGFLFILLSVPFTLLAQLPKPSTGQIHQFENFKSALVAPRTIDVWLPDNYNPKTKYAVLYMHDGKGLYDSSIMWNKQEWKVDEVMGKLQREGKIRDCIVVGVYNSEKTRHPEYFPQKPFESLTKIERDSVTAQLQRVGRTKEEFKPFSDNYLKFLVTELKPFIDQNFSTKKDRANTFIAGSSMGGLISLYAICEYPDVFGGAACLSTHWPGVFSMDNNPVPTAFYSYIHKNLPDPQTHKIYFDYGDQTLDALYPPLQKRVDEIVTSKGYSSKNWMTQFFPGENHSEKAWSKRLDIPFLFLLKK
ncbi:MAG: alpha/beta hydrolase [Cyclobacteriaceae bacterium]|jgi:enterochelin esterase-like enzyme|nr:esterase family protein [Flammeovirgaceae bacterium]